MTDKSARIRVSVNDFRLGWNAWVRFSDVPRDPARCVGWMAAARENQNGGSRPVLFRAEHDDDEIVGMMHAYGIDPL